MKHEHLCPAFNMQAFVWKEEKLHYTWLSCLVILASHTRSQISNIASPAGMNVAADSLFYFPTTVSAPANPEKVGNN